MPYPSRAIRTADFLLIRNFKPDRLPLGDVYNANASGEALLTQTYVAYPDMDASPTKAFLVKRKDEYRKYFDYGFAVRPEFELYDLKKDPDQVNNVASKPKYAGDLKRLTKRLMNTLRKTRDPRVIDGGDAFDKMPFVDPDFVPPPKKKKVVKF